MHVGEGGTLIQPGLVRRNDPRVVSGGFGRSTWGRAGSRKVHKTGSRRLTSLYIAPFGIRRGFMGTSCRGRALSLSLFLSLLSSDSGGKGVRRVIRPGFTLRESLKPPPDFSRKPLATRFYGNVGCCGDTRESIRDAPICARTFSAIRFTAREIVFEMLLILFVCLSLSLSWRIIDRMTTNYPLDDLTTINPYHRAFVT